MDRFLAQPSGPLHGEVPVQGAKNSVLKLMAACLLAPGRSRLHNVPHITDVQIMSEVLEAVGASVSWGADGELIVDVPEKMSGVAPYELVEKMRASIVVLGPLLARHGYARISLPGGDDFGSRPINFHLRALTDLGAVLSSEHGYVEGRCDRLTGTRIVLEYPSHTATDNVVMAAVLAKGTTVIENAAREPEVQDLAEMLNSMGARVTGAGTSRIVIEGVDELHPTSHTVIPDRVEAATLISAVGLCGGQVRVRGACAEHMDMFLSKVQEMGMEVDPYLGGIEVAASGRRGSVDVATLPYPGVATDYKPLIVTMLSISTGVAIVTENLFVGRFRYIDELCRMGADIRTEGHHAVVRGIDHLQGAVVRAADIRAGAALVLAGLVAEGETVVLGLEHIDRGYERFGEKLASIGAQIVREAVE